jgi:hypothetical protein
VLREQLGQVESRDLMRETEHAQRLDDLNQRLDRETAQREALATELRRREQELAEQRQALDVQPGGGGAPRGGAAEIP